MENTIKLNWNGLTDKQQEFTEKIVNNEVLHLCNELMEYASVNGDYIEFDNSYDEENENWEIDRISLEEAGLKQPWFTEEGNETEIVWSK